MKPLKVSTLKGVLRRPIVVVLTPLFALVMIAYAVLLFAVKTVCGVLAVPFIYGKQVGSDLWRCLASLARSAKEVW